MSSICLTAPKHDLSVQTQRQQLIGGLFASGMPRLWCPTLTHFRAPGELDEARIRRHLDHLAPYVKGLLVPGSTGEGWEMSDDDIRRLLAVVSAAAQAAGIGVLIGVLKHTVAAARDQEPPLLYSGARLPAEFVDQAVAFLRAAGLFSDAGYLHCPTEAAELRIMDG